MRQENSLLYLEECFIYSLILSVSFFDNQHLEGKSGSETARSPVNLINPAMYKAHNLVIPSAMLLDLM